MDIIEKLELKLSNAKSVGEKHIVLKVKDLERILSELKQEVKQVEKPVYKAGQKVRIIANTQSFPHHFQIGEVVELAGDCGKSSWFANYLDGHDYWIVTELDIEPIEEKQPEKPVYKVGQKVRVIANSNKHDFKIGEVVKLADNFEENSWTAYYLDNHDFWTVVEKDIEPIN